MEVRGQPQPVKFTRLHLQRAKWTGGVTQRVEHLFCKHEALSSNPSSKKKKKGQEKEKELRCLLLVQAAKQQSRPVRRTVFLGTKERAACCPLGSSQ
jgi:hypothetical protein